MERMRNCAFVDQSQLTDTATFKARAIFLLPASIRQSQQMTLPIRQIQERLQPAGKFQRGIPVLLTLDRATA
ncbi:MAG: hypothetical protein CMP31_06145 [Roseibacillus sp.]|nr:hypothetical protein [Roseibacillus sp.]